MELKVTLLTGKQLTVPSLDKCELCGCLDTKLEWETIYKDVRDVGILNEHRRKVDYEKITLSCPRCGHLEQFKCKSFQIIEK